MEFEIIKSEGLGRLCSVSGKSKFKTPDLLSAVFFDGIYSSYLHNGIKSKLYTTKRNMDTSVLENEKRTINSLGSLIIYPSLQMQGKSIDNITCSKDLFPSISEKNHKQDYVFHLIPWDLPLIFLGKFRSYLKALSMMKQDEFILNVNLTLNIPCTQEILDQTLPKFEFPNIKIVCLGDISSLLNHPSVLIRYLIQVRSWIPPNVMLYAPGVPLSYIPILVYLGVDLFDLIFLRMNSINSLQQSENILENNVSIYNFNHILLQTRQAIENGKLRDLARIYANSYPPMKTLLRISDRKANLTENTPLFGSKSLYCTDETDFTRPEVSRFRRRVRTRYTPPLHHQGLIFLPCSAKKPYSTSKSHQLFRSVIKRNLKKKRHYIGEVILTSPLSVVPRDLEFTYPAAHYDIPVTGKWSEIEKKHLKVDLLDFIRKIDPLIPIAGYVKGIEREILNEVCSKNNRTLNLISGGVSSLTSRSSLKEFGNLLKDSFKEISPSVTTPSQLTFLRSVADFQFGKETGLTLLPDDVRISGYKELGLRVKYNNTHLLAFRPEIGLLTLSLEAGKRLLGHTKNYVRFHGEKISGSTIFAKGIIDANPEICPNEEVLVINSEGELLATGTTYLSGTCLVIMNRGRGVKIRQKVK
jgi:archaeosine synthase